MIGLQRIFSLRFAHSIVDHRNLSSARRITILRPLCSSTNNSDRKNDRSKPASSRGGETKSSHGLIRKKFLAAADTIKYHILERSPDPTEEQLLDLEAKLGYSFKKRDLLRLALTHKSAAAPSSASLSWVGDSVLQLIITEQLAAAEGYAPAGRLTELRSLLASREHCAECATDIGLHHVIISGKGMIVENEMNEIKFTSSVLGESFEAVIGAVFVDGGILAARRAYVKNFGNVKKELERMKKDSES